MAKSSPLLGDWPLLWGMRRVYFKMVVFPLSLPEKGGFFLTLCCGNFGGMFLEVVSTKYGGRLGMWPLGVSHYYTSIHCASRSSSKLSFKHSYQFMVLVSSAPSSSSGLWFSVFTISPDFRIAVCLMTSVLWCVQVIDFQFV